MADTTRKYPAKQSSSVPYPYTSPYPPGIAQQSHSAPIPYPLPYQPVVSQHPISYQSPSKPDADPSTSYGSALYQQPYQSDYTGYTQNQPLVSQASDPKQYQTSYQLPSKPDVDLYASYGSASYQQPYQPDYTGYSQPISSAPYNYQPTSQPTSLQQSSSVPTPYPSYQQPYKPYSQVSQQQPVSHQSPAAYQPLPYSIQAPPPPGISGVTTNPSTGIQHPTTTFQTATPYSPPERQSSFLESSESTAINNDPLAIVSVRDGEDPQTFTDDKSLSNYIRLFPEAENDQGCRVFRYGPKCPPKLLLPLFEHLDFPRFSIFPYGLANDFFTEAPPNGGTCRCERCSGNQPCGHYVLHHNFQFYKFLEGSTIPISSNPKIATLPPSTISISTRTSQYEFRRADWNLQVFRFRSHRIETSDFAHDALIYQNYEGAIRLRSSPFDYLLSQLDVILINWDLMVNASSEFLSSFRFEVLEERLESDRTIIRNLLLAAQHWEEFRQVLKVQQSSLGILDNVHLDPRWTEGQDNLYQLQAVAAGYSQRFRTIEYRVATDLIQETDHLIQRVTNLISIDEGYRSRDQNQSIKRLTWITFIFLPLVFTAGLFGMNIDLFRSLPSWRYYVYASIIVFVGVIFGYALLRGRRRAGRSALYLISSLRNSLVKLVEILQIKSKDKEAGLGIEAQPMESAYEISTVLKWAASSGRTDVVRKVLQGSLSSGQKPLASSGPALFTAIRNGHQEAAALLIDTGQGLDYVDEYKATLLHCAAKTGQSNLVRKLLEKRLSSAAKDLDGQTALDYAMVGNDEPTINLLLRGGEKTTRQETANIQSLHFSARSGDLEVIKELYRKGSSLEARDGKGQTVLFHAVKGKQHNIIEWLCDHKVNIQSIDKKGFTALHVAAQVCDLQAAETLIEHGADVNALSIDNLTPLLCLPNSEGIPILRLLLRKGASVNAVDKGNNTIAHNAASRGDVAASLMNAVRDLGGDMYASGSQGNTPVHLAARSGSVGILEILASGDNSIYNSRNTLGYTPLMVAAHAAQTDVMRYLLKKKVSYDVLDATGKTLIHLTIEWGNSNVMQVLQEFGANYHDFTTDTDVAHPIWKAIQDGQTASIERLLDSGLSLDYKHNGISLLQLAAEANNADAVRLLLKRGGNTFVNRADRHGWTAMHSAAFSGNAEYVSSIIRQGGNKDALDEYGWTPLDLAAFYRHDQVISMLDPEAKTTEFAWMRSRKNRLMGGVFHTPSLAESAVEGVVEAPTPYE